MEEYAVGKKPDLTALRWLGWVVGVPAFAATMVFGGISTVTSARQVNQQTAEDIIDRAIELMGGAEMLRGVERVSLDMMTQWQRTEFGTIPFRDRPSFERHHDVRDYSLPAWRNTREFGSRSITNVVVDSVAVTDFGNGFQPLSIAYVDERAELFMYTPDRLVLLMKDAPDVTVRGDTTIGNEPHTILTGTLDGRFRCSLYTHSGTGLPAMLRFRAGHPNDYGLVPWGEMEVSVWYSSWRSFDGINIPTQWDIERVGEPYKRMSVLSAEFNPMFEADSFVVAPDVRTAYFQTATKPMHETRQIAGVDTIVDGLLAIRGFGFPAGAVALGESWLLLGAGQAPYNYREGVDALRAAGANHLIGVLVLNAATGNGGVLAAVDAGLPVYVSEASEPFVRRMLENAGRGSGGLRRIDTLGEIEQSGDRLLAATIDLANVPNSVILYKGNLRWVYAPDATEQLDVDMVLAQTEGLGWTGDLIGTSRSVGAPISRPDG